VLTMAMNYGFEVRAFGCNIQVEAPCPEAYATLGRFVFPSLPRAVRRSDQPHLLIRMVRVADQIQLLADDVTVASARTAESLVPDLIRVLDDAVIQRLSALRAIHAGAVLWNGRVLLLPGPTHSGKSSLVAELLKRGAAYFSDEYALIDSEGRAHPYPRPLLLRNGCPDQVPMLPSEWNAPVGDTPARIGWILSLAYQPSYAWTVAPISQSEALLTLLQNTPHALATSQDLVEIFERAVAGAACYAGRRPDAAHAVDQILRLVSGAA
jgi:hypothetical protein